MGDSCSRLMQKDPVYYKEVLNENQKKKIKRQLTPNLKQKNGKNRPEKPINRKARNSKSEGTAQNAKKTSNDRIQQYIKQKLKKQEQAQKIIQLEREQVRKLQRQRELKQRAERGEQLNEYEAIIYKRMKQKQKKMQEEIDQKRREATPPKKLCHIAVQYFQNQNDCFS